MGCGEAGRPLLEILGADGYDPAVEPWTVLPVDRYQILHVTIPYSHRFVTQVYHAQTIWGPQLTIIHSTVPIGTTAQIDRAVHSPISGQHPLKADLLRIPKPVGGPRWHDAAEVLAAAGIPIGRGYDRAEQTEALKLLCLAKYGTAVATAYYAKDVAQKVGLTDDDLRDWDLMYNSLTNIRSQHLCRPVLTPWHEKIGGHCLIPGIQLLQQDYPDPLLEGVLQRG